MAPDPTDPAEKKTDPSTEAAGGNTTGNTNTSGNNGKTTLTKELDDDKSGETDSDSSGEDLDFTDTYDYVLHRRVARTQITTVYNKIVFGTYKPSKSYTFATMDKHSKTLAKCETYACDSQEDKYNERLQVVLNQLKADQGQPLSAAAAQANASNLPLQSTQQPLINVNPPSTTVNASTAGQQSPPAASTTGSPPHSTSPSVSQSAQVTSMTTIPVPPMQVSYSQIHANVATFDGSSLHFGEFIHLFELKYEQDPYMKPIDKFLTFKTLIGEKNQHLITGLAPDSSGLIQAKERVKRHFANPTKIKSDARARFSRLTVATNERQSPQVMFNLETCESVIASLHNCSMNDDSIDNAFYESITSKFPFSLINAFNSKYPDCNSVRQLLAFIRSKAEISAKTAEDMGLNNNRLSSRIHTTSTAESKRRAPPNRQRESVPPTCALCGGNHVSVRCQTGTGASRRAIAVQKKLCLRCMRGNHPTPECRSTYLCSICQGSHSRALCVSAPTPTPLPQQIASRTFQNTALGSNANGPVQSGSASTHPSSSTMTITSNAQTEESLAVIPKHNGREVIAITGRTTSYHQTVLVRINGCTVRMLIDSGSGSDLMSEELATQLNLEEAGPSKLKIRGACNGSIKCKRTVHANLESLDGKASLQVKFHTADQLGPFRMAALSAQDHQTLADRGYELPDITTDEQNRYPIQLVLGLEHYCKLWTGLPIPVTDSLHVWNTIFGWTLCGVSKHDIEEYDNHCAVISNESNSPWTGHLDDLSSISTSVDTKVDQYLDEESPDTTMCNALLTDVEQQYVDNFIATKISCNNGRYCVRLPWLEPVNLHNNRKLAYKRFSLLLNHLYRNEITQRYHDEMTTMIDNFAEEAPVRQTPGRTYIMPTHPVIRLDKATTQLRIVCDCSSHMTNELSLNSNLFKGTNTWDSFELLFRFRFGAQAAIGDIEKAFWNIEVHPDDRDALRFLWFNKDGKPTEYRFKVVPFGTSASPFLLYAVLTHHFNQQESNFPELAPLLKRSFYVDDLVKSLPAKHPIGVHQFITGATSLLEKGKMKLRKCRTNDQQLDKQLAPDGPPNPKLLGHHWNTREDTLSLAVDINRLLVRPVTTKRMFSSFMASIYDRNGFITPYVVLLRLHMQKLWQTDLGWDDEMSPELAIETAALVQEVRYVNDFSVPRNVTPNDEPGELIVYCDANPNVVGIVAYCRTATSTRLLMSRATVSEKGSIPALELKGMIMAAKCIKELNAYHTFTSTTIMSDSLPNLQRLEKHPNKMPAALALTINELKRMTPTTYRHVRSKLNIADLITKGCLMSELLSNDHWWNGPPQSESTLCETTIASATVEPSDNCTTSSTYRRALGKYRIIARWMKTSTKYGELSENELALILMIKDVQRKHFRDEIKCRESGQEVSKQSILYKYQTKMDVNGILRLRTRLENAPYLTYDQKYPIIMPANCTVSKLVITREHQRILHAGVDRTMEAVRDRYFIIQLKKMTKRIRNKCNICKLIQARTPSAPFGALPSFRIAESTPPFTNTGLDIYGPLKVNVQTPGKVYGMIFTCATTRAVHLEPLMSMTADEVFQSMRRFMARRGVPRLIYSDNGSQLIAIKKRLLKFLDELKTSNPDLELRLEWQLQTALSPWRGGFYERLIRTIKTSLVVLTLRKSVSTFELATILYEIEGRMNSRPLFTVNGQTITPAHFFTGKSLVLLPAIGNNDARNIARTGIVDEYIKSQRSANAVWSAWRAQYLLQLRQYHENAVKKNAAIVFRKGDVVLLKNNSNISQWPMGLVEHVRISPDDKVRTILVRTKERGHYEVKPRAIQTVIPLECQLEADDTRPIHFNDA